MKSQCRTALLAGCVLSFVALPGLSRDAQAAPIDNDVVMEWQQKAYANFFPTVTNGNFVVNGPADLGAIEIAILVNRSDLLGGYDLTLDVVNPFTSVPGDYTPILVAGSPLRLTYAAGEDNNGDPLPGTPDPDPANDFFRESNPTNYSINLALSDFQNFGVLAGLLASGPLGFSVNGHFYGSLDVPADIGCQNDPTVCATFPGSASIAVSGGQAFPPVTSVPEPGSLSLLLIGIAGGVGFRRRLR